MDCHIQLVYTDWSKSESRVREGTHSQIFTRICQSQHYNLGGPSKNMLKQYILHRLIPGLFFMLCLSISAPFAHAEVVAHELRGLELTGNLELADGKTLAKDGVALIVHGTTGHHRMEIIARLQENLANRGINSLAVTFSMGLDARQGSYPCKLEHDYRHMDGVEEISSWISWLKIAGTRSVTLVGHSRGANQAAMFMSLNAITAAGGLNASASDNIESVASTNPDWNANLAGGVVKIRYGGTHAKPDAIIKSLVLIAPMTWTYEKARRAYPKRFKKLLGSILAKAKKLHDDYKGMMLMKETGFLSCPKARVTADAFIDFYAPNPYYFTPNLFPFIKRSILVIAGSYDEKVPELPAAIASLPYSKTLELQTINGADHFFQDVFGDQLAEYIAAFISRSTKSKS